MDRKERKRIDAMKVIHSLPKMDERAVLWYCDHLQGELAEMTSELGIVKLTAVPTLQATYEITPVGIRFHSAMPFEDWAALGVYIGQQRTRWSFALGDWLVYGEGRGDWGETYAQGLNVTQYSEQTLKDYAWISRNVDLSIRNDNLSHSHHRLIAPMDDVYLQAKWLDLAVLNQWSCAEMRNEIRAWKAEQGITTPTPPHSLTASPTAYVGTVFVVGGKLEYAVPDGEYRLWLERV